MTTFRQVRDYDPDDPLTNGRWRGSLILRQLQGAGIKPGFPFLDIGAGYGGLSFALAEKSSSGDVITCVEADPRNVAVINDRLRRGDAAAWSDKVLPVQGSALDLPVKSASVALAMMIGVVEWLGFTDQSRPVRDVQLAALREVSRVLRRDGRFVLGTKNRAYPRYWWEEAQTRQRFVGALPRPLADGLSRLTGKGPYRSRIYTQLGWTRLLQEAGLRVVSVWVPIYNYQYPLALVPPGRRVDMDALLAQVPADDLNQPGRDAALTARFFGRDSYYRVLGRLGLLGAGGGFFLFVCEKRH